MIKIILFASFVVVLLFFLWQSYHIVTEKHTIEIIGLPRAFDGFRIVHLSDLHGRRLNVEGHTYSIIKQANPDIVVITGDFVSYNVSEIDNYFEFLESLASFVPVYAVSGNHDYGAGWPQVKARLEKAGLTVLDNTHKFIYAKGERICLVGVSDPFSGRANLYAAMPEDLSETIILLAHSPTWFEASPFSKKFEQEIQLLKNVALTLSGHTHGGQIKIPFVGPLTTASGRLFPQDYIEGLSWEGYGWLYISRGIGYAFVPIRFLSPPEVAVLELKSK